MSTLWKYFECHRCGKCCIEIGLPYDPHSIFSIAETMGLSVRETIERYYGTYTEDGQHWISDDSKRTPCPFLRFENECFYCMIYSVRPEGCRLYPMQTDAGPQGVDCPAWPTAISKLKQEQSGDYEEE